MNEPSATPSIAFDPLQETAQSLIKILDRADGGKEFILPALRNFRAKIFFSIAWLMLTAGFVELVFLNAGIVNDLLDKMPAPVRFVVINHTWFYLGIYGLIEFFMTIICLNMWLRSSRIIATTGELRVVTHWLVFKRAAVIPASRIIEIRADNTSSVGADLYYDIVVLTMGEKKSWLATHFPASCKEGSSFTENDLKAFNTGGNRIHAATEIKGQPEANWLVAEMNRALGRRQS
jgi:hypothetical protein